MPHNFYLTTLAVNTFFIISVVPGRISSLIQNGARPITRIPATSSAAANVPACVNRLGSMCTLFFTSTRVTDYATAKTSDTARFGTFFRRMREKGVFLPPSQFEAMFVSLAHTDEDVDLVITAAKASVVD